MHPHKRTTLAAALAAAVLAPAPALAQESPSPSPSPTKPPCGAANFSVDRSVITAGEIVTVTVHRDENAQEQATPVSLTRLVPEPSAIVRSDSSTAAIVEWPLRLGESHDFSTEYEPTGENCHPLGRPNGMALNVDVRPVVTIAAKRTAPRDYTFSGRVLPARSQRLSLWRLEADGRRILTARGIVGPDGTYGIDRRFTGSGRFGFQVDVAATEANLWGQSNIRPTVIH